MRPGFISSLFFKFYLAKFQTSTKQTEKAQWTHHTAPILPTHGQFCFIHTPSHLPAPPYSSLIQISNMIPLSSYHFSVDLWNKQTILWKTTIPITITIGIDNHNTNITTLQKLIIIPKIIKCPVSVQIATYLIYGKWPFRATVWVLAVIIAPRKFSCFIIWNSSWVPTDVF